VRHAATVLAGIRNTHAAPSRQKEARASIGLDRHARDPRRGTWRGMRDRAMLLVGFAGGLRRSEIVGLDVGRDQTEDGRGWIEILPLGGEPGPKLRTESCGAAIAVSFAGNISSSRAAINIADAGMPSRRGLCRLAEQSVACALDPARFGLPLEIRHRGPLARVCRSRGLSPIRNRDLSLVSCYWAIKTRLQRIVYRRILHLNNDTGIEPEFHGKIAERHRPCPARPIDRLRARFNCRPDD
jgi:integrase